MANHDDFAFEPVKGLPENLPTGEKMLWQGGPDWMALARNAFHVLKVAAYFALLAAWRFASALGEGDSLLAALGSAATVLPVAAAALGILCLLAWLYGRSTVYTMTTKRIVIRSGLALPVTLNLPFSLIDTASVGTIRGSIGNIALKVTKPNRIAYLVLWPNAKPFAFSNPVPLLRAIPNVDQVAAQLGSALEAASGTTAQQPRRIGREAEAARGSKDALPAGTAVA